MMLPSSPWSLPNVARCKKDKKGKTRKKGYQSILDELDLLYYWESSLELYAEEKKYVDARAIMRQLSTYQSIATLLQSP